MFFVHNIIWSLHIKFDIPSTDCCHRKNTKRMITLNMQYSLCLDLGTTMNRLVRKAATSYRLRIWAQTVQLMYVYNERKYSAVRQQKPSRQPVKLGLLPAFDCAARLVVGAPSGGEGGPCGGDGRGAGGVPVEGVDTILTSLNPY